MFITKRFAFCRLPAIGTQSLAWREHLTQLLPSMAPYLQDPNLTMTPAAVRGVMASHMPELLADFDSLLVALPGLPPQAAQCFAMYGIRPFFAGCSVTISRAGSSPTLLRNYDLGLDDHAGIFRYEELAGGGWILGSAEGGWGYVDGLNDRGLAVAITFGGKFTVGNGFAVPIVVRYLLHTCSTVAEAVERLQRLPHRLAQNLVLLDRSGAAAVVYASPDQGVSVDFQATACTNHQRRVVEEGHARFVRTVERLERLHELGGAAELSDLLCPPLYTTSFQEHFGTVYSAELDPARGTARYAWPGRELLLSSDAAACELEIPFEV